MAPLHRRGGTCSQTCGDVPAARSLAASPTSTGRRRWWRVVDDRPPRSAVTCTRSRTFRSIESWPSGRSRSGRNSTASATPTRSCNARRAGQRGTLDAGRPRFVCNAAAAESPPAPTRSHPERGPVSQVPVLPHGAFVTRCPQTRVREHAAHRRRGRPRCAVPGACPRPRQPSALALSSNMWWAGPCPFSPSYVGRRVASESVNNSLTRWTEGAELRRATPCVSVPS